MHNKVHSPWVFAAAASIGLFALTGLAGYPQSEAAAQSGNACPVNLGHLASKLPVYDNPELVRLRRMILQMNVLDTLRDAQASHGLSQDQSASLLMQQAQQYEAGLPQVEECIRASSDNPDAVMRRLQSGQAGSRGVMGLNESCQAAYVAYYYGLVANKELAVAAACHARSGR